MKKSARSLIVMAALAVLAVFSAGRLTLRPVTADPAAPQADRNRRFQQPPEIISLTPSLQVARTEIVPFGDDDLLRLTLRNDSEKAIVSFSLCTQLNERGRSSMTFYGPDQTDEAVPAHGERTEKILAFALTPGKPLIICAATFADGTQEGHERILKSDKESYEKMKKERRHRRGGS